VGADLDGDLQPPSGIEATVKVIGGSAQPTFLNDLAAFVVDQTQIAVAVAEVQTCVIFFCSLLPSLMGRFSSLGH